MIERLSFAETEAYNAVEAAIHLSRYSLARHLCAGKKVLDISCGEGYGSALMATRWGAAEVHGVDVSADAIDAARARFDSDRITFHCRAAENLDEMFEPESFDLIVCLETMEHVPDAARLIGSLQRLRRGDGALVLSCPNDWWYYPEERDGNPYHVRKFTYDEFQELCAGILGPPDQRLFGLPVGGYANVAADAPVLERGAGESSQVAMFRAAEEEVSMTLLPTDEAVSAANCSYFVGIWGATVPAATLAVYPASMDRSELGAFSRESSVDRGELRRSVNSLQRALRDTQLIASAWRAECEYSRQVAAEQRHANEAARRELDEIWGSAAWKLIMVWRRVLRLPVVGSVVRAVGGFVTAPLRRRRDA